MRKYMKVAVFAAVAAAGVMFHGCEGGDMNSREGIFRGCYSQVSKVQSALDAAIRTRGTLEGINTLHDAYTYMSGGSETKYKELERRQQMYCTEMTLETNVGENYYLIEAFPISARDCRIFTEPDSAPEPRELHLCR